MPSFSFAARIVAGLGLGATASATRSVVLCDTSESGSNRKHTDYISTMATAVPPSLKRVMDPSKDMAPIRMVIVGGGYSGARLAYQFDSICDITLIDEKNYFEQANDLIPVVARKWTDATDEALSLLTTVHRFYLKRANVLTGTATEITENQVRLKDGRVVDYDILFVTIGEKKPFPFGSQQKSLAARLQELRHFNEFLGTKRKVAIVGGGPMAVSLAGHLAQDRPEMEIDLFQGNDHLVPKLPTLCQEYAEETLSTFPNLHLRMCSRVVAIDEVREAAPAASGGLWSRIVPWSRSKAVDEAAKDALPALPESYKLHVDVLERQERKKRSLLHHVYFGPAFRRRAPLNVAKREVFEGYDYVFSLTGDTPREIPEGFLRKHVNSDGHIRVSIMNQVFGHPNVFVCGRCTNLPVLRSAAFSDAQTRTIFRNLLAIIYTPKLERYLSSSDGIALQNYVVPRIVLKTSPLDGLGCNSWGGPMVGTAAVVEYALEKKHLQTDFTKPLFFKRQDPAKVRTRLKNWMSNELTDICDFSF